MPGLHPADIVAIAAYFVLVVCLGFWTARRVKSMSDFVMPRRFGKTLMIFFGFGAGTHSDQAVSVASKSYTNGASVFTENIYKPLVPHASQRHYLWLARLSSLGVVASGVVFAYSLEGVVAGLEIFWKLAPMLGIAFWLGLFWRRMTVAGAWASTLAAFGAWWLSSQEFFIQWAERLPFAPSWGLVFVQDGQPEIYLPWQMISYLGVGVLAGVVVSLLSRPVAEERLERFYALIRTPVTPGEDVEQPCTLPPGAVTPPPRKLLPLRSLEIYVPSAQMLGGFLAGWLGVAVLIAVFLWLV